MWEILSEGGIGLMLLINNANPDPLADLQGYLHAFKDFISKTAVAIGVTHMDRAEAPDPTPTAPASPASATNRRRPSSGSTPAAATTWRCWSRLSSTPSTPD